MSNTKFDALIRASAEQYLPGHDWRLLKAQLMAESNLDPNAVSPVGAIGIAQFMPATWKEVSAELNFPVTATPQDVEYAIPAAAHYMKKLLKGWTAPRPEMDRYCLAMASYNAGMGNLYKAQKKANGANGFAKILAALDQVTGRHAAETRAYIPRILHFYSQFVVSG